MIILQLASVQTLKGMEANRYTSSTPRLELKLGTYLLPLLE